MILMMGKSNGETSRSNSDREPRRERNFMTMLQNIAIYLRAKV